MRRLFKISRLAACAMAFVLSFGAVMPSFADDIPSNMDDVIKYESVNYNIPGMAITIVKDGEVLYDSVQGVSDLATGAPMNADTTVIQTGSVGKVITSMTLLHLLDQHGISLDAPISDYLIDAYLPEADLTFRDLLQHTTGIPSLKAGTALTQSPLENDSERFSDYASDFMTSYKHKAVMASGTDTIYSNVGMVLSGLLIEALSNTPYEHYVSASILEPLGLKTSSSILEGNTPSNVTLARGYTVFGGEHTVQPLFKTKLIASEDFVTTPADMTSLLKEVTSQMYSDSSYRDFFTRQVSAYEGLLGRSLGFTIKQDEGVNLYLQDGGIPGETARLFFIPEIKLGAFIWYNSDATALRDDLTDAILSIYAQDANHETHAVLDDFSMEEYRDLIGAYSPMNISTETIERVTRIIGQIRVSEMSDGVGLTIDKSLYKAIGNNTFYSEDNDNYARFIFDDSGKLNYLVIDNTYYKRSGLFESLYFDIPMLFFTALFNLIALLILLVKWDDLRVNRIHSTPRTVLLLETLFSGVSIGLTFWIGMHYSAWSVAYSNSDSALWLKVSSIIAALLYVPSVFMLNRGGNDFRWRGATIFVLRTMLLFNLLLIIWLWRYNFI